ncbi:PRC-barrel domain-containing protein [Halomonas organivorans]
MTRPNALIRPLVTALLATGLASAGTAQAAPQGLYSADELLDAEVTSREAPDVVIGEVEDLLLDDDMRLRALVIDTGNLLDMGEKQYVIEAGEFSVETRHGDRLDAIEYRVTVDLDESAITRQPEYTDGWWSQARQNMQQAWSDTREDAASAWETTQEGASRALDRIGRALEAAGERTQRAAEDSAQ